jgi:hypothetical protein
MIIDQQSLPLIIVIGLAWTVTYIEAIRLGFRDKTYAIPALALALNFTWEWLYTIRYLQAHDFLQAAVCATWTLADTVIAVTFFRFGRHEWPAHLPQAWFVSGGLILFGICYAIQARFLAHYGLLLGARYSAFLSNALMSALFIVMLLSRRGLRGQSMLLATAKWLGTFAATILVGVLQGSVFALYWGVLCFVLDLVYIGLVIRHRKNQTVLGGAAAT